MTRTTIRTEILIPRPSRSLFVALFAIPVVVGFFGCSGSTTTSENTGGSTSGVGGNLSGGNSGLGGTSSNGGKAGSGGSAGDTCNYTGNTYAAGSQVPMGDGCNICICSAGSTPIMQCTTHVCPGSGGASSSTSTGGAWATGGAASTGGWRSTGGQPTNGGSGGSASNACGGCAMGEICIFQNGGPGPSHYTCATQLPCGSAGACSCIVNQGTCSYVPGDAGVFGICSCDNGLD